GVWGEPRGGGGGAVRMTGGGHGREPVEVLPRAGVVDLLDGAGEAAARARKAEDLDLGYRHSNLRASEVVTAAEFEVTPGETEACEARVAEIVRWRREHQPGGQNAGSVFRNPPGDSAGRQRRAPHRRRRAQGAARRRGGGVREARQLLPGRGGRDRSRRHRPRGRGPATRGGVHRRRARSRAARRRGRRGVTMTTKMRSRTAAAPRPASKAIDPRIRERRVAALRAQGRRRLRWMVGVVVLAALAAAAWAVTHSSLLDVERVRVTGTQQATPAQVRFAAGVKPGDAILFVDTGAIARNVERVAWI